jgi:ribosome-associated translation inhibitor RaiA
MKVEIQTKCMKNEFMVREFIQRKVSFALERLADSVRKVSVLLEDETCDSPAFDGYCRIEVYLQRGGQIYVSASGESASDCVLQAIRKMEQAVKRERERKHSMTRTRHQNTKRFLFGSLEEPPDSNDPLASDAASDV